MSDVDGTTQELMSTVAALQSRLSLLEQGTGVSAAANVSGHQSPAEEVPIEPSFGRRSLLKRIGGVGIVGAGVAAASLLNAQPAAAATGDPLRLGQGVGGDANTPSTQLKVTSLAPSARSIFAVSDGPEPPTSAAKSAIAGVASGNANVNVGVSASSTVNGGSGVAAYGTNGAAAITAISSSVHLKLSGPGTFGAGMPSTATLLATQNLPGSITLDATNNLWMAVEYNGSSTSYRKLTGPDTAGSLHVIDPLRVYDSRAVSILAAGSSRVVPVTGVVVASRSVPAGARAIVATLTLTGTQNTGFMTITAGDVGSTSSSSINWFGSGQDLATTVVSKLDGSGRAKLFNNSGNASHFILDITGYYL
jgi:hypothetical protein